MTGRRPWPLWLFTAAVVALDVVALVGAFAGRAH